MAHDFQIHSIVTFDRGAYWAYLTVQDGESFVSGPYETKEAAEQAGEQGLREMMAAAVEHGAQVTNVDEWQDLTGSGGDA